MNTEIKAVYFDLGGVYYTEGFRDGLSAIARKYSVGQKEIYDNAIEIIFSNGYLHGRAPEKSFWNDLAAACDIDADMYTERVAILTAFQPDGAMASLVSRLRELLQVGLLTDQTNWLYDLDERDALLPAFDTVVNSYEEGFSKRDPEIFRIACERFALLPHEIAFFDDNPGNVEKGNEFGVRAYLFESAERTETLLRAEGIDLPLAGPTAIDG
ncbi:MAG: HAD-IA family hydrolase [bacterium]|nr:HAD-IA family hydrolase [bacterium]MDT8395999.1 HAD-IA family hydrolase [bacterium]